MKGGLPKREPEFLARWAELGLYDRLRADAAVGSREPFILHDGPPYANGNIHIGHAMNKILKDVINRSQQMMGRDARYVPGWDCHGLPIEWKIEEKYRSEGKDKDDVPVVQFRQECRDFAQHWIDIQREEFKRLGVLGDWDNPYTTMSFDAEAQIVREFHKFLMNGGVYQGARPVMWSVVEKTALAEAEVEYEDHESTTIDVRFAVQTASNPLLEGACVVIWTTTPWTIPGNTAIAFGEDIDYAVIAVTQTGEGSLAKVGEKLVLAAAMVEEVITRAGITGHDVLGHLKGRDLAGTICHHPWHGQGYDYDVPLVAGYHVTIEQGTGFVHIAPCHGVEDWEIGQQYGLTVRDHVGDDGVYYDHVPLVGGQHVFKIDKPVVGFLTEAGGLLASGKLVHSYPHSWRSKARLIYRTTPQWFISMENNGLRKTALDAIDKVRWVPESGRNRIYSMIEARPDWVVSRQRAWGVPLTLFVDVQSGEPLCDAAVNQRIVDAIEAEGADAWFTSPAERFLGNGFDPEKYKMTGDILDVWFDSGSSHAFVLENREELSSPASLYLEGTDQHRGWFHSSLLESCGTRGRAPYDAVLTHGFVMDGDGRKMSKSLGNVVAPQKVIDQYGADILRLWVASSDYSDDTRIGDAIIKSQVDTYRRLRNTLRFVLGNLADFDDNEKLPYSEMPELERWALHRIAELDQQIRKNSNDFDYPRLFSALYHFCAVEMSAFYLDIRKDVLYCDAADSINRRAARTVLDALFHYLTAWLAPVLCFTAEEVWLSRFGDDPSREVSVHLRQFPDVPAEWTDHDLGRRWQSIREVRRVVTGALEVERREKRIGASMEARPTVYISDAAMLGGLNADQLAEISITSGIDLLIGETAPDDAFTLEDVSGVAVVSVPAPGGKCQRCWQVLPSVGQDPEYPDACGRCVTVLRSTGFVISEAS